ncbi:MAG: ATP-binding cassette domain-containing protein [Candidatus Scalindua sp.]|jgi:putative ABC transport system ATP-binding protein|nr:ATP-binding cassette domain-containing protein [Candidatus Scalindua sp.]MBT5305620.1 ATP-binding cassette domain-containing protein [Candidatus Scalindua sp.]MBT6225909.1 ATP-binding cassette domain-containing protein [Candidatus Scalindua sp.]MBT6561842.1 ATP-binding cassette domain-containing protein [Candidatus Scalindua sp.]MBT7210263.1 ATP-binding cassette domain-containing protein [Candidatus Scalindua sp.]
MQNAEIGNSSNIVFLLREVHKTREKGGVLFELRIPFMTAKKGEFLAIVGLSGCGKSTLLDMLGLVLKPTSAKDFQLSIGTGTSEQIKIDSLQENELASIRRKSIGYVLQTGGLLPFLTVEENIMLPGRLNQESDSSAIFDLVKRLGIADQLTKKPKHLSGGQRQRVAIARALACKPPLVLADEPTAAVDRLTAIEIRNEFKELTQQMGVTLIMVTHDKALVENVADRIFTFNVEKKSKNHTVSTIHELKIT